MSTMPLRNDLAAIVERLEAIEKILAKYIDTVHAAEERKRELQGRQRVVRAEVTFDDASKRETQAEANRQHATQRAIAKYAFWAFCAAFLYAGVSAIQLQEMRIQTGQVFHQADIENANASGQAAQLFRQLNIAQQQARATQQAARIALETLEVSQRAFLVIEFDRIDYLNKSVILTVKNVGHIPPSDIRAIVHEATVSRPPGNPDKTPTPVEEMHWTDETVPGYSAVNVDINVRIPRVDQQRLGTSQQKIFIVGVVTYNDGFPKTAVQKAPFCWDVGTRSSQPQRIVWGPCDWTKELPASEQTDEYPSEKYRTPN